MFRILPPLLCLLATSLAAAGEFRALSLPGSQLGALSADGRAAAGGVIGAASGGFRWQEGEAPRLLERAVSVRAMSASGRHVAGSSLDAQQREVATWWDVDGTVHPLGGLPGAEASAGLLSAAWGINDEPQVVGVGANGSDTVAVRWTAASGWQVLQDTPSAAIGLSDDGRRVYGWSTHADAIRHAALWDDGQPCCAPERLHDDTRLRNVELVGANRAATILLGVADLRAPAAYRWTPSETAVVRIAPAVRFTASSGDGRMLAGVAGSGAQRVAMVWTSTRGVERLQDFLAARAITVPAGWSLLAATALSADGRRLGGFGLTDGRFDSFIVDLTSVADAESLPPTAP